MNHYRAWMLLAAALGAVLGACTAPLETPEGRCEAARTALIVAESEGLDEDTQRRAALAVLLTCGG